MKEAKGLIISLDFIFAGVLTLCAVLGVFRV